MTILILMAAVFLGAGLTAAGCKWRIAWLGWISFLAAGWRRGVPRLAPWSVAAHPARPRGWLSCSPGGRSSPVPGWPATGSAGRTSGCGCGFTRAGGRPPC